MSISINDYSELYSYRSELKKTGFGGTVLFNKPQSGFNETNYLGDPIQGSFSDTDNRRVWPPAMFDDNSPIRDYFP